MPLPTLAVGRRTTGLLGRTARALGWVVLIGVLAAAVLFSPALLRLVDDDGADWNRLSDIGQSYGPVAALLSALALCVAVLVQRRQIRQERVRMAREMHVNALRTAMDDPVYGQCWGARVTPDDVDEKLYYYTNMVISTWLYAWECGELSDNAVRAYVRAMAESEIPRAYWKQYGAWRLLAAHGPRRRFLSMVDAEFKAAEATGPPSRAVERPDGGSGCPAPCCRRRGLRPYPSGPGIDRTMRRKSRH
ncbi:hypothetical protein Aab01nite_46300 [Paractinoplanes abujensis]|uniref:Uncharacterized protein n=1 Tax=Paractinoplanes abujensis TaxID=882441 RepID=A0A7W7FZ85_9ACTN|nr:DUF6082 family protein [Actinoplanes abujensis]MBB4690277.1 hypothetical protein [Actinoplanes abujensis]GID21040.1 hypothetical protein Aab01nite_46300 [Actinoplanes abujensis]